MSIEYIQDKYSKITNIISVYNNKTLV